MSAAVNGDVVAGACPVSHIGPQLQEKDLEALKWSTNFPSADLVEAAAAVLPSVPNFLERTLEQGYTAGGINFRAGVAPGAVSLSTHNIAKALTRKSPDALVMPHDEKHTSECADDCKEIHIVAPLALISDGSGSTRGVVRSWSRKSRANMVRRLAELDWSFVTDNPGNIPAMITLTYPGLWLAFAPTGPTAKAHMKAFEKRYKRAWGEAWPFIWKLEFQGRGAPHFHLYGVPPRGHVELRCLDCPAGLPCGFCAHEKECRCKDGVLSVQFKRWLSLIWTDIISSNLDVTLLAYGLCFSRGHGMEWLRDPEAGSWPSCVECREEAESSYVQLRRSEVMNSRRAGTNVDFSEGMRSKDPKRLAVYFMKKTAIHNGKSSGGKEYQHVVPAPYLFGEGQDGPGRFWGARHIARVHAEVPLSPEDYIQLRRALRRWQAAQKRTIVRSVERVDQRTGVVRRRRVRRRYIPAFDSGGYKGGWVLCNDGPAFASQLARWLAIAASYTE